MIIDIREKMGKPRIVLNEQSRNFLIIGRSVDQANFYGLTALNQLKLSSVHNAIYAVSFNPPSTQEKAIYGKKKDYIKRIKKIYTEIKEETEEMRRRTFIFVFGADNLEPRQKGYEEFYDLCKLGSEGHLHVIAITTSDMDEKIKKFFTEEDLFGKMPKESKPAPKEDKLSSEEA